MKLEVRAQAYNALNKIYGNPNISLTSAAFGSIVQGFQANGARSGNGHAAANLNLT